MHLVNMSHPVWVRGLKLAYVNEQFNLSVVAPCMGAWIETSYVAGYVNSFATSHPVWVRGLKQDVFAVQKQYYSRTLYGCVD